MFTLNCSPTFFRSLITLLFKISVAVQLEVLCLSLAGIFIYILTILLSFTQISNQLIIFWLLTGTALTVFAWNRTRNLLFAGHLIKVVPTMFELAFFYGFVLSSAFTFKASLSHSIFNSGDFSSFVRLTSQFTSFSGPWKVGAFEFIYTSADRLQINRNAGPFYPQATHFMVAMIDQLFNFNNPSRAARLLAALTSTTVLPFLFILLGQTIRQRRDTSDLISLSFIFSILFAFNLNSGQIPAATGATLMIFILIFSISLSSFRAQVVGILFGGFLLLFVHPSSSISLFLLSLVTMDWKEGLKLWRKSITTIIPLVIFLFFMMTVQITDLYKPALSLFKSWGDLQINSDFQLSPRFEIVIMFLRFVLSNLLLFGHLSLINFAAVILIVFYIGIIGLNVREKIRIPELLILLIVLSSSLGGANGFSGLAKIPSIFWYSSPSRIVHIWTICFFYRICNGTSSRNGSSVLLTVLLMSSLTIYTFHLVVLSKS